MEMEEERPQPNGTSRQLWTQGRQRAERLGWIIDQLSVAAVAKGQVFTQERLRINAEDLIDISQEKLATAFAKARRELDYAPGVSEIRRLAAADDESRQKVEAEAAWNYLHNYLLKWGVGRIPIRSSGKLIFAPKLEPRLDYALRRIGGLWRLNQVTDENYAFVFRDFCEAYSLAPVAEQIEQKLFEQFASRKLLGSVMQLTEAIETPLSPVKPNSKLHEESAGCCQEDVIRRIEGLSPERKAELMRELAEELETRGISKSAAGLE